MNDSESIINSWPKISIVTPSYNQGNFLERTILSIINQDYPNLEYIIIDGGSSDNSVGIIKKYQKSITYWVSEKDNGQTDAINKGWQKASGEIIAYLNSDDTYVQGAMKKAALFFWDNTDVDALYGICNLIDENDNVINTWEPGEFDFKSLLRCGISTIPQQTVFFRRKILDEIGFLDSSLRHAMDYEYWLRIGQKFNFKKTPYTLANFRVQAGSKTSLELDTQWLESYEISKKYSKESKLQWFVGYYFYKIKRIWPKFIRPLIFSKSIKERLKILRCAPELIRSSFWVTKHKFKSKD